MAIDKDLIEIELAFEAQQKSADISLFQRITEWLKQSDYQSYNNLLTRLESPIHLQDARNVSQLLATLRNKPNHTPAEMMLLGCTYHPKIGLPLCDCLKKLASECNVKLDFTELNDKTAATYFNLAAEKGFISAIYLRGEDHYHGICVSHEDDKEAIRLWQQAADGGFPPAINRLGEIYETQFSDIKQAVQQYQTAAKLGHAAAWHALGRLQQSKCVLDTELPSAIECFKTAAKLGDIKALRCLIDSYQNGFIVAQDYNIADSYTEIYLKQADINQTLLYHRIQLFLSNITYHENSILKAESLSEKAIKGLCGGYIFMLFRAALIGESDKHLKRLRLLSHSNNQEIKEMAKLYNDYLIEFKKLSSVSIYHLNKQIRNYKDNNEKRRIRKAHYDAIEQQVLINLMLTEQQKNMLEYSQELYIFISSLLFSHELIGYTVQQGNRILTHDNFVEILNIIPPDVFLPSNAKTQSTAENKDLVLRQDTLVNSIISQPFAFCFNFLEHELIDALNRSIFPGDCIYIGSTTHLMYLERHLDKYSFYDSASAMRTFVSTDELVTKIKHCFFTNYNRDDKYLSVRFKVFVHNQAPVVRPTVNALLAHIFQQRGNNSEINAQSWDGTTALYLAARFNNIEVVNDLLARGADPNITNNNGISPARIAIIYDYDEILELLAHKNAELRLLDREGNNLVGSAVRYGSPAVIKVLANIGVQLDRPNNAGLTPLYLALDSNKMNMVIALLSAMKSTFMLSKIDAEKLNALRYELLSEFFYFVENIKDDKEKLEFIDAVLETDKSKQNALGQFFQTPANSISYFFSMNDNTGSIIKIERYRDKLVAKMRSGSTELYMAGTPRN